jgi:6-phosphofructokinase 1
MNAALRAVVRSALNLGIEVYGIYEGYRGMVLGNTYIQKMTWNSVGGILQQGGTVIGTARCAEFRTREGRRQAAKNLIDNHIDNLVVIGGDGSLTGADVFRREWPELLDELVELEEISAEVAKAHAQLQLVGLVGSIDNDMFGTDMTIGTDTALHRIVEALDAIASTAASHQRTFVVEVMGRHCGYLAMMSAVASGANWVLVPEHPPDVENWESVMCQAIKAGREVGRRHSIVIVAEGACDRQGNPITSEYVKNTLEEKLGEEVRITVLGHVQRGGSPSAFDRNMSTMVGHAAVHTLLEAKETDEPQLIGIRENQVVHSPLMACVAQTHEVADLIKAQEYDKAMSMRGGSFDEAFRIFRMMVRTRPHPPDPDQKRHNLMIMHAGGPAPGMNTAVRVAIRVALDQGHTVLGVHNGFEGLIAGDIEALDWMTASGWVSKGGAELGTSRYLPEGREYEMIARQLEHHQIEGLMIVGGWTGYRTAYQLLQKRDIYAALNIPIVCLPASINNNLPGSEYSVGADTALNSIVENVDQVKESAVAMRRCFVVEVMGRDCGYLALMGGLATGAEQVYLPEEGVSLAGLTRDVELLIDGFKHGKRLGLMIRNENVDPIYTIDFMCALFEKEGGELFDVRKSVLGHAQQGGSPSPFDRIQATRLAARCMEYLIQQVSNGSLMIACIGLGAGRVQFTELEALPKLMHREYQRPNVEWWLDLRPLARLMAQPSPRQ